MRFKLPVPESWKNDRGLGWLDKTGNTWHPGFDFNDPRGGDSDLGKPIFACADGVVEYTKDDGCGFGKHIFVRHNLDGHPIYSHYAHLEAIQVSVNDEVCIGQQIGLCGYSGRCKGVWWSTAHLHFEIRSPIGKGHNFWPVGKSKEWIKKYYFDPVKFIEENNEEMTKLECFRQCFITVAGRWPDNEEIKEWKKSSTEIYTYVQNNSPNPLVKELKTFKTKLSVSEKKLDRSLRKIAELEKIVDELAARIREGVSGTNDITKESLKELARVLLFALISFGIAKLSSLPETETTVIGLAVLRTVDKVIHLIGKETGNEKLLTGLSRF